MSTQKFVGNEPVESFSKEETQKIDDETLTRQEASRDPAKQPGANKRAGAASRNPQCERSRGIKKKKKDVLLNSFHKSLDYDVTSQGG
ncbi:hypothetical protein AMATHDRAFT_147983 [Amanita thiersii Skay4041]|uniref:Uncharacterized protein n=1 Tax=Amanita thiersii Skay4041 TaxID=703135 RepID=A0A2A9NNF3_9AGAR|nr:hypothetical protein AMATHDRAFT_147983 [Amanita thiersii Skay4041]